MPTRRSVFDREFYNAAGGQVASDFLNSYKNNDYYSGKYTYGPVTDFKKVLASVQAGGTSPDAQNNLQNSFDIGERIWAGYVMNTINFGKLRLQAGVRIESTQDSLLANNLDLTTDPITVTPLHPEQQLHQCFSQRAGPISLRDRYDSALDLTGLASPAPISEIQLPTRLRSHQQSERSPDRGQSEPQANARPEL